MKTKIYYGGILFVLLAALTVSLYGSAAEAAAPAKPTVSLVKRTKNTAKIAVQKKGKVSGYQVWMKSSANGKYQLIMGMKTKSYTIKKLKANKTYYVRVRAFITKGYHITFGKYSAVLKIKPYQKPSPAPSESPQPSETPIPSETLEPSESPDPSEPLEPTETPPPSEPPIPSETPES